MFSEAQVALTANYTTIAAGVASLAALLWKLGTSIAAGLAARSKKMGALLLLSSKTLLKKDLAGSFFIASAGPAVLPR